MKKQLAILLLSVLILTCALSALSAAAASYKDEVNLLPASEDVIKVNGGVPLFELKDGKLSLTRDGADNIAWPSIIYEVNQEADMSKTPYLHMSFETSGAGDRGVNGFIYYSINGGEEIGAQISDAGGNGIDDFRDTADMIVNLATYIGSTDVIYIHRVALSVYGGMGETIVWNALALASAGEGDDEPAPEESSEASSDEPEESSVVETTSEESSEPETSKPAESTPAETSSAPETTSAASSDATSDASTDSDSGIGTLGIVLIVVGCVAVVAVVVVVILKKKK